MLGGKEEEKLAIRGAAERGFHSVRGPRAAEGQRVSDADRKFCLLIGW